MLIVVTDHTIDINLTDIAIEGTVRWGHPESFVMRDGKWEKIDLETFDWSKLPGKAEYNPERNKALLEAIKAIKHLQTFSS